MLNGWIGLSPDQEDEGIAEVRGPLGSSRGLIITVFQYARSELPIRARQNKATPLSTRSKPGLDLNAHPLKRVQRALRQHRAKRRINSGEVSIFTFILLYEDYRLSRRVLDRRPSPSEPGSDGKRFVRRSSLKEATGRWWSPPSRMGSGVFSVFAGRPSMLRQARQERPADCQKDGTANPIQQHPRALTSSGQEGGRARLGGALSWARP